MKSEISDKQLVKMVHVFLCGVVVGGVVVGIAAAVFTGLGW